MKPVNEGQTLGQSCCNVCMCVCSKVFPALAWAWWRCKHWGVSAWLHVCLNTDVSGSRVRVAYKQACVFDWLSVPLQMDGDCMWVNKWPVGPLTHGWGLLMSLSTHAAHLMKALEHKRSYHYSRKHAKQTQQHPTKCFRTASGWIHFPAFLPIQRFSYFIMLWRNINIQAMIQFCILC